MIFLLQRLIRIICKICILFIKQWQYFYLTFKKLFRTQGNEVIRIIHFCPLLLCIFIFQTIELDLVLNFGKPTLRIIRLLYRTDKKYWIAWRVHKFRKCHEKKVFFCIGTNVFNMDEDWIVTFNETFLFWTSLILM